MPEFEFQQEEYMGKILNFLLILAIVLFSSGVIMGIIAIVFHEEPKVCPTFYQCIQSGDKHREYFFRLPENISSSAEMDDARYQANLTVQHYRQALKFAEESSDIRQSDRQSSIASAKDRLATAEEIREGIETMAKMKPWEKRLRKNLQSIDKWVNKAGRY